ncbi:hypothetical protein ZHAS_00004720 [Anopheles sinensis]|uniref:Uncharacterized protein n=1 Tax=Anopheles sinensis TaxID=74873 RepID=A0A084VHQ4_ANOSI|nr:hypothetical protein ZHAS_00004720 [Anopheles sinensis]
MHENKQILLNTSFPLADEGTIVAVAPHGSRVRALFHHPIGSRHLKRATLQAGHLRTSARPLFPTPSSHPWGEKTTARQRETQSLQIHGAKPERAERAQTCRGSD